MGFSSMLLSPISALAQDVELAWDLHPGASLASSDPGGFAVTPSSLFFTAHNDGTSREVWVLDDGAMEPRLLRDLEASTRRDASSPGEGRGMVASGTRLYFDHFGTSTGCQVWTSDGAETRLVGLPLCASIAPLPGERALIAGIQRGDGLWLSDGTVEGTRRLQSQGLGENDLLFEELAASAGRVFFTVEGLEAGAPAAARELWVSDGSEAGTIPLTDFGAGGGSRRAGNLVASGEELYFFAGVGAHPEELWKSDGTPAGTFRVATLEGPPGGGSPQLAAAGASNFGLVFALDDHDTSCSLWRSDGTSAGTYRIQGFSEPEHGGACPSSFAQTEAGLFFSARAFFGPTSALQLWVTDGTSAVGTRLLRDWRGIGSDLRALVAFQGRLYFQAAEGRETFSDPPGPSGLWSSDGTAGGTVQVFAFDLPSLCSSEPAPAMTAFEGRLYFCGPDAAHGRELWASDGTGAGTQRLANLAPDVGSTRLDFVEIEGSEVPLVRPVQHGDQIIFATPGGLWAIASDPWRVEQLVDGSSLPGGLDFTDLTSTDGELFFITYPADIGDNRLWASDGTREGTRQISTAPEDLSSLAALGRRVCFFGSTGPLDIEPWCSDGTDPGTRPIGDFFSGPTIPFFLGLANLTRLGNRLLFSARSPTGEHELWVTNGRAGGTGVVSGGLPGVEGSGHGPLTVVEDAAFFVGGPPGPEDGPNSALWVWRVLQDPLRVEAVTEVTTRGSLWLQGESVAFRGRYFFTLHDLRTVRLLSSDGTAAGTRELLTLPKVRLQDQLRELTPVGNDLFFVAPSATEGEELWATDGTPEGTRRVADIAPGLESSLPRNLVAAGSVLLFTASDGVHGFEPWRSDGTAEGTRMVVDLQPGPESSTPTRYTVLADPAFGSASLGSASLGGGSLEGKVLFNAWTRETGRELWAMDLAQVGSRVCVPQPGRFCLGDDRFEVLADWRDPRTGDVGRAEGSAQSQDTGKLWFFNPTNLELLVKILDGSAVNGHGWLFYGSLTDLGFWLSATDLETGVAKTYVQRERETCGGADTLAFPLGVLGEGLAAGDLPVAPTRIEAAEEGSALATRIAPSTVIPAEAGIQGGRGASESLSSPMAGSCTPDARTLCLLDHRFKLRLAWSDQRQPGRIGEGMAVPESDRTGFFWFFRDANLELMVKVLDGRPVNGKFWIFYGSLTDVEFDLEVTDTVTGAAKTYHNPPGEICGRTDTAAF